MATEREEFQDWIKHPVTKAFLHTVYLKREEGKERLILAVRNREVDPEILAGYCAALGDILNIDYEDIHDDK